MPSPCHRLDRDTTGVVVFAKNPRARAELGRQFEERELEKVYVAAVLGRTDEGSGLIDAPLGPAPGSKVELRMAVRPDGQKAVTSWSRVGATEERSLLELRPKTGRQHQLRAHLAHLGHPILGDKLYLGRQRHLPEIAPGWARCRGVGKTRHGAAGAPRPAADLCSSKHRSGDDVARPTLA